MKRIKIEVEDSKYEALMSFLETIDYISVSEIESIPQWQKDEVSRREQLIDSGNMSIRKWEEAKKDIFKN